MRYEDILDFLYKRAIMRKKWDLKKIKKLLGFLGNPEKKLKVVHITGTNGKGSTTAMIASVLKAAGYRTGMYISPHIDEFRERITINGVLIPKKEVVEIFVAMKEHLSKFKENELSFFEITTAIAYVYFEREKVEYAVLETGLGGRLDATNVVNSVVSVITNVDVEHVQYLGNTIRKIAREKGGIIKKNSVLVTGEQKKEVLGVLREICSRKDTRMILVGRNVRYRKIVCSNNKNIFEIKGREKYVVKLPLLGEYQGRNAAVAAAVAEALDVEKEAIKEGLEKAWLPARLEVVSKRPLVIMDAAHNPAAMINLRRALRMFSYDRLILVIGIMRDKDIHGIMSMIGSMADVIIINKPDVYRAAEPEDIAKCAGEFCRRIVIERDVGKSLEVARSLAKKRDFILITGSMYMLSEAREVNKLRIAQ